MARTAPVPNIPPIPGMCPGMAVLGGGGGSGGGSGKGAGSGGGGTGAGGEGGADGTGEDGRGGEGCGDPVCPISGRVFLDIYDFGFAGPSVLSWLRSYSSRTSDKNGTLGHGWSHTYAWKVRVGRNRVEVYDDKARVQIFGKLPPSGGVSNAFAWSLQRHGDGLKLWIGDESRTLLFGPACDDGFHHLVAVLDANDNRIAFTHDRDGRLVGMKDSAGRPYQVTNDRDGHIVRVRVATSESHEHWMDVVTYEYDVHGDLVAATDAEGFRAEYRYDNHLLVEHVAPNGLSYLYRYDGRSKDAYCVETWGEYRGRVDPALEHPIEGPPEKRAVKGIHHHRLSYDKGTLYSEVVDGLGGVTRYFGDTSGRVTKKVDPLGGVTEKAFSPDLSAMHKVSRSNGAVFETLFDDEGRAIGSLDPSGHLTFALEQEDGSIARVSEAEETVITTTHDRRGNVQSVRHNDGVVDSFVVDSRGLLLEATSSLGVTTRYQHDAMGNLVRAVHVDGSVETSDYDYLGRRTAHVDTQGRRTEWAWDRRSEIVLKRYADGSELHIQRDALRNPVVATINGRTTRFEYGGVGWVTKVIDPDGRVTEYRYDVLGNLTLVRNGRGQEFRQQFDVGGNPIGCVTFEGQKYWSHFDHSGNMQWVDDGLGRRALSYDINRRVTEMECDDQTVAVEYSPTGLPTRFDNGTVMVERDYQPDGNLIAERIDRHCTNVWYESGKVRAFASDVGVATSYYRGTNGLVTEIDAGVTSIQLAKTSDGSEVTFLGRNMALRRTKNATGHLVRQALTWLGSGTDLETLGTDEDPHVLWWIRYEYDDAHHLRSIYRSDGTGVDLELNRSGQVVGRKVVRQGKLLEEEAISYDGAGSPTFDDVDYDAARRPVRIGHESLEYDAKGRLSQRRDGAGSWEYRWDTLDNLVEVRAPDHRVEMDYDAEGRRIRKRVFRGLELVSSKSYMWAKQVVLHEIDELSGAVRSYLRHDSSWEPLGHVDTGGEQEQIYFYLSDPVGAIDTVFDVEGKPAWVAERTIFGDYRPSKTDIDVDVRFANQHWDEDVGLVYNYNRWYEPRVGLYVSPDPLLLDGTLNPRDYAPNPYAFIDPTGLMPRPSRDPSTFVAPTRAPADRNGHPGVPPRPSGTPENYSAEYLHQPGHYATNGTPDEPGFAAANTTNPTSRNFNQATRNVVDTAGNRYGCHSCGRNRGEIAAQDGVSSNFHFVPDHQPPVAQIKAYQEHHGAGNYPHEVRLYPHCHRCSLQQRDRLNEQSSSSRSRSNDQRARERYRMSENARRHGARNTRNSAANPRPTPSWASQRGARARP